SRPRSSSTRCPVPVCAIDLIRRRGGGAVRPHGRRRAIGRYCPAMSEQPLTTVLTGATGFVGSLVLERLIARGAPVTALVRARDDGHARRRLEELAVRTWGDAAVVANVAAVAADLERERLGLADAAYDAL